MTDSMSEDYNKEQDSQLAKAIEECKKVAASSSKEAKENVAFIKDSIETANKEIVSCIKDISKQKIRDEEILTSLKKQLTKIKTTFVSEYDEVEQLVDKKIKEANKFNITLFGRTKVGKSTLMEILTNGNGSSIGKGGQRTTLNVRQYKWKGLTITDIPGIDAFQGDTDDRLAFEAAKSADIVVFMISDGQPEATEADWLVRLKREDKPIVCLCNAKYTLEDELDMEMFLDNPDEILKDSRIKEIIEQFNNFVKEQLPNEHIDIYVTQLQARYLANKKEYAQKRQALLKASRFYIVEKEIQKVVIRNGISFRRKCFFSIIDSPLYSQSLALFENSNMAYLKFLIAKEKMSEFCNWQREYIDEERPQMIKRVDQIYEDVISSIPHFVEDNLERNDFGERWKKHVESMRLSEKIQDCYTSSVKKAKDKVNQLFKALETESKLQTKIISDISSDQKGSDIANWKRRWGWASAGIGAAGSVAEVGLLVAFHVYGVAAAAAAIPVVGWIAAGGALLFGIFSWLSDSREMKLRKARVEQERSLRHSLINNKRTTKDKMYKAFNSDVISGLLSDSYNRFSIINTTLLTLANSQRELGLRYLEHHTTISKKIIISALYDLGIRTSALDHIDFVARIPGKKTVIGCSDESLKYLSARISEKIGNKEEVRIFNRSLTGNIENQLRILKGYFHLQIPMKIKFIEKDDFKQKVVYIPIDTNLSAENETNLLLLQQILNVHIIKR